MSNLRYFFSKSLIQNKQKRASKKALNLNGGVDASRFELFKKYISDLFTPETDKIYGLINQLAL